MNSDFKNGLRDGIPIGLGYLAVSFSLGIAAKQIGMSGFEGFIMSLLNNASAGEYAGMTMVAAKATAIETAIMILIANARYLLMSTALSQHLDPKMPLWKKLLIGFDVTDELFAIAMSQPEYCSFDYYFGAMCLAIPGWSVGTLLGIVIGNLLPARIVSAFCVALFGMFIAVIIPAAKKDKVVFGCILVSFAASSLFNYLPMLSGIAEGTRTIILTLAISAGAALLFPKKDEEA